MQRPPDCHCRSIDLKPLLVLLGFGLGLVTLNERSARQFVTCGMGNSQSAARAGERPQNRLSKPPTNLPPLVTDTFERGRYTNLEATTQVAYQNLWLDSAIESPTLQISPMCADESPEPVSPGGLGDMDFELRPGKKSPSTLTERMGDLKRRFSVPSKVRSSRISADAKPESECKPDPKFDGRVTVMEPLNPGLGVTFADDTHFEGQATKRPSAFRRLSMRTPGIATRMSGKLAPPKPSPTTLHYEDDFHMYTDDQFTPEELLYLDEPTRPRSSPRPSLCRASTPNDFEYSYLGGLKLGSLRVVNGCASPAPSNVRPRSFSESTVFTLSRDDLKSPLRYGSSPDTVEGASRRPLRHRLAQTTVAEEMEQSLDATGHTYEELNYDAPEPTAPLVASNTISVEEELFDEGIDTSTPNDTSPEKPIDPSPARRKGTVSGLSKSDSGYSSASSKYPYSLRRRRTAYYGTSSGTYCAPESPPPMPEITISRPQTSSSDRGHFAEMSRYTPPDLTLTFPTGGYWPRIDTEIPSCNDFLDSFFPERASRPGALKEHKSWPLSAYDSTQPMPPATQTTPTQAVHSPLSHLQPGSPKAAKLAKPAPPPLTRRDSAPAHRYLTRVKSLVNLRKQYSRRYPTGPSEDEHGSNTANQAVSAEKQERVPNRLKRDPTRYKTIPRRTQTQARTVKA